jgi:hypothetical protein
VTVNTAPGHFDRKQYQSMNVARRTEFLNVPDVAIGEEAHSGLMQPSLRRLLCGSDGGIQRGCLVEICSTATTGCCDQLDGDLEPSLACARHVRPMLFLGA